MGKGSAAVVVEEKSYFKSDTTWGWESSLNLMGIQSSFMCERMQYNLGDCFRAPRKNKLSPGAFGVLGTCYQIKSS